MRLFGRSYTDWRKVRERILRETADYITDCLRHPDKAVHIPMMPADRANWSREYSEAFWRNIL